MRTAPAVRELHRQYGDDGLIVIGVHTPEFYHEHDVNKVRAAIERLDIPYAVTIDNDSTTWKAFGNHYWPALYLIDKRGVLRETHVGELHVDTPTWRDFTGQVEELLAEPG